LGSPSAPAANGRPAADKIAALLEPIVRQNIPGAADTRIVNWQDGDGGPTALKKLVLRRPPAVSLYSDYDLTRQVMVMNRLRDTPIVCWLDRDDKDLGTPYYVM
jgi:aminoglycoside phosphotransferase (APT) family kinase protein